ncbi:AAA family ATPase [Salinisphaera sp. RV14]|uniref:AAA family ATPase n=1 Tax=Salinisphaera sp. RV14 TaxID=3454140 RepID=UPI003F862920
MSTDCDQTYNELWDLAFDDIPTIKLFDHVQLEKAHEAESTNAGRRDALSRLLKSGEHRRLAIATSDMMNTLDALQRRQPNCAKVIVSIRRQIALGLLTDSSVLRLSPLLLDGPPGIGKTHFACALAEALGMPLFVVNCSSVTASFVLGGNSPSWAGSRPGKIVEALRDSSVGNPIILLDEVDKLRGDLRFDGYGPLYQLLEEDTAGIFEDEHIGVPIDASRILWLATSNNPHMLPEPIRSRFETLTIDTPMSDHASAITQSVYDDLLARENGWEKRFSATLPADVKRALSGVPPREIRRVLMGAIPSLPAQPGKPSK